ncbi:flagellar biosynthesis protein [Paucibacter aquatile]|uniref:Flagellar assembly protein FliH n=1 Tax=Kinneretia aquatilis TaxID=2070761 RepID=A0A2N8KRB5_9BURK|nr:FliH/SctL family protein [Paucibacter aquatile]PND36004.1 flagellar biosynthesis protein [Paucibacter aquatile]
MTPRPPRQVPPPPRDPSAPPRTSSYSRFIPREEVQSFAAWNPDAFHGAVNTQRAPISAPAPANAQPEVAEPAPPPEPDLQELLHAARQTGYQDGYRDGMAALDAFKKSFAQQMSAQIGQLVSSFDADFRALEDEMARSLARCAVELARQVVRSEITQRPEHIAKVAHDAVEALQLSARHVRVRVNPSDYPLVQEGAGEELRARDAQLLPDPEVPRGGCRVDSDISSVDASLAARWQQAAAAMGQASLWEDRRSGRNDAEPTQPTQEDL